MNERLRKLRKTLDLTQQEFADRLGIKRSGIANYESGRNKPIDVVITLICREFNVNEEWLRNGEGEMFVPRTKNEMVIDLARCLLNESNSFKNRLITGMVRLDESDWEDIERIVLKLTNETK